VQTPGSQGSGAEIAAALRAIGQSADAPALAELRRTLSEAMEQAPAPDARRPVPLSVARAGRTALTGLDAAQHEARGLAQRLSGHRTEDPRTAIEAAVEALRRGQVPPATLDAIAVETPLPLNAPPGFPELQSAVGETISALQARDAARLADALDHLREALPKDRWSVPRAVGALDQATETPVGGADAETTPPPSSPRLLPTDSSGAGTPTLGRRDRPDAGNTAPAPGASHAPPSAGGFLADINRRQAAAIAAHDWPIRYDRLVKAYFDLEPSASPTTDRREERLSSPR
jgi:hypothetical protein